MMLLLWMIKSGAIAETTIHLTTASADALETRKREKEKEREKESFQASGTSGTPKMRTPQ